MQDTIRVPVAREKFQEWIEDRHGIFMGVSQDGGTLTVCNDTVLPEITALFVGEAGKFNDTVEICGMYDNRTRAFRFVTDRLASIVEDIPVSERWPGIHTSEEVYAEISRYGRKMAEESGYRFQNSTDALYAETQSRVRPALSALPEYAAVLAARGEHNAVLDTRDLAAEMLHFWQDLVYLTYEKGFEKVERQYLGEFDRAVSAAREAGQAPALSDEAAAGIYQGLALHAEAATENEDGFSVWECCRLAKRLAGDHPAHSGAFTGNFTVDYSDRYTRFGSLDHAHLHEGLLLGRPVAVYNHPIPDEQIPQGWHSYHLAGRNLRNASVLLKEMPEQGYLGTVLSPYALIRARYQSRQIREPFGMFAGYVSMEEFCDRHGLPEPHVTPKIENRGMSL